MFNDNKYLLFCGPFYFLLCNKLLMYRVTIFFDKWMWGKKKCIVTKVNVHSFVLYNLQSKAHLFCPSCVFFFNKSLDQQYCCPNLDGFDINDFFNSSFFLTSHWLLIDLILNQVIKILDLFLEESSPHLKFSFLLIFWWVIIKQLVSCQNKEPVWCFGPNILIHSQCCKLIRCMHSLHIYAYNFKLTLFCFWVLLIF